MKSPVQILRSSDSDISPNFRTSCCNLNIRGLGAKLCLAFLLFLFSKELWRFEVRVHVFVEKKIYKVNKNETESKMENPTHTFRARWTMCSNSYKNCNLKVKLWWVGARERKNSVKKSLFCPKYTFEYLRFIPMQRVLNKPPE